MESTIIKHRLSLAGFLEGYSRDGYLNTVANLIVNQNTGAFQLKGLAGSLDAIVAVSIYKANRQTQMFVMRDKEEAAYFFNDLQQLLPEKEILMLPASYKKPYQFEETENANVLMRAEILNKINQRALSGELVVSYPEALTEKVINKKSLQKNTFAATIGDQIDLEFFNELLITYDFEKSDFVYEAGQFSIRGGIVDIFSYGNELPFRLEFFGDELESIRTFDPTTQLSVENIKSISIIPNVQTKLLEKQRQSFLDFLPANSKIWFKDLQQCQDTLDAYFDKANENFESILKAGGNVKIILKPEDLFENSISFNENLQKFCLVEFGNVFYQKAHEVFKFESEPQPSFNKNFELLVEHLQERQTAGFNNIMLAESEKQLDRLSTIFEELDPYLEAKGLLLGLREGFVDKMNKLVCFTDHQLFERYHRYKLKDKFSKSKALTLKELNSLQPGDYVTHIDYGIGKFAGLDKVEVGGKHQEMLRLIYRDDDLLYVSIHSLHKISKYSGREGNPPTISKLGTQEWEIKKKKAKKNVQDIAKDLISLYAKRKAANGFGYSPDSFLQAELESSFIYEDTPDQAKATMDVKSDMEQPHPMDRLVCGDVGFGKTEVAIRAAMKACADGKQVAVLVPTTILALQHYHTFKDRLSNLPVEVAYINRFKSAIEITETLKRLESGEINILIGTHKLVGKQV
ncbi:MAG: CarD family transcriptional regulator, partial [Cyclobacteriaceae bacterium]